MLGADSINLYIYILFWKGEDSPDSPGLQNKERFGEISAVAAQESKARTVRLKDCHTRGLKIYPKITRTGRSVSRAPTTIFTGDGTVGKRFLNSHKST